MQWFLLTGAGERDDIGDTDPPRTLKYEPAHEILGVLWNCPNDKEGKFHRHKWVNIALLSNQGLDKLVQP